MKVTTMPTEAIPELWGWLSDVLGKPIAMDDWFGPDEVLAHLKAGHLRALLFEGEARGVVVFAVGERDGRKVFFVPYLAGEIEGGPKRRLKIMRAVERAFCAEAVRLGCSEIRGGGRAWDRLLPGWERAEFGLRKVLLDG